MVCEMVLEFYTSVIPTTVFPTKKKGTYMHIVHANIHKPTWNNSFFISAIWNVTQRLCEATICFLPYKRWQQQDMKFKRSTCMFVCVRDTHTHTHAHNMNFIKSHCVEFQALWDVMMCHWVNSFWQFKGSYCLWKISNHYLNNIASHPSQFESPAALLREPHLRNCTSYCGILPIPVSSIAMKPNNRL